ncbi:MAG: gliding motility-associated C-terminal domain-containing protein [Bacteroidia bacterium]
MKKIVILTLTFTLFLASYIKASHIAGGDLSYICLGNNQYQINLNLFVDCNGFDPGDQQFVDFVSSCGATTNITVDVLNPGGTEISQLCSSQISNSTCNGGNLPGMWVFYYTGVVTLAPPCDTWTMSWNTCCRNAAILNLDSPDSQGSYIEATLNSATAACNNSPSFTSQPIPYVCANQAVNYNYGIVETDGDSLHYSLVNAMDVGPINLTYSSGYSATSPIPGITVNPTTGVLSFTPTAIGNFVVVVLVEEFDDNGMLIGTVMRDIQFVVQNCGNLVPDPNAGAISNLTGAAVQSGPFAIELCEGVSFSFTATYTDPDPTDSLMLVSNIASVLPGATITTSGANPMTATVNWTAPAGSANTNTSFSITINDGACPVVGQQTFVYDINVNPRTLGGPDKIICGPQSATMNGTGGSTFTWSVISGDPIVVGTNFSCNPCANPVVKPSVTTTYEVVSDLSGTCVNKDTVTITVVPDFSFTTTQSTDTLCLQQQVQLGISGSPAGAYVFGWSPATYLDDDSIANPLASITVPGTYDYQVNITSPFGCLKKDTVTVTVLPEIRTYAFADTTLCLSQSGFLSANGGTSFVWSSISGSPVTVGSNFSCNPCANAIATPAVSTVYQVTSNLGGTCINKDTVNITVVPDFTTTTTQTETITCLLQPPIQMTITPSPAGTYTYSWSLGQFLNDTSVTNPVATITTPGTHNFVATVTAASGCVKKDTVTITITPSYKPEPVAYVDDNIVCIGDTIQLGVTFGTTTPSVCGTTTVDCSAPLTAVIGNGTGTNTSTTWPAPYGNWYTSAKHQFLFRATELNAMGITGGKIDQLDFNVTEIPSGAITTYHEYTINMGCTNTTSLSTWITGLSNVYTPKTHNVTTGWNAHPFDMTYEWDGVSNLVVEICFTEGPGFFGYSNYSYSCVSPYTTTAFTSSLYIYSDAGPQCPETGTPSTSNNRTNTRFHYCGGAPDSSLYTYNWHEPSAVFTPTTQTTGGVMTSAGTEQYYVIVTDTLSGCFDTAYVDVTATSPITISVSAGNDTTVCPGAPASLTATGADSFTWAPATDLSSTTTASTTATPSTTITYTVTGISECITGPATDMVTVNVLTAAPLVVTAGADQEICGTPYNLVGLATGGFGSNSYMWTTASGSMIDSIQNSGSQSATVTPTEEMMNIYQLTVTDFCGDTASDYTAVNVFMSCKLDIPNVFTPNGDGKNDVFLVKGIGMKTYSATIYDRWGKKVYESTDIKAAWDGSSGDDGTYYYIITAESNNGTQFEEKGYLLRLGQ